MNLVKSTSIGWNNLIVLSLFCLLILSAKTSALETGQEDKNAQSGTDQSYVLTAEEQAEAALTSDLIDQIRAVTIGTISNYEQMGVEFGWDSIATAAHNARVRLDSMLTSIDDIIEKFSPPAGKLFDKWKNKPSIKKFLNRFLNLLLQPARKWRTKTGELLEMLRQNNKAGKDEIISFALTESPDSFPQPAYYDDFLCTRIRDWDRYQSDCFHNSMIVIDAYIAAIGSICSQDVVVGGGGNIGVFKAVMDVVKGVSNIVKRQVASCQGNVSFTNTKTNLARLGHMHVDLEIVDSTADFISLNLLQHRQDFAEWTAFSLRTWIEINLAGHGDHPHPIATFQLPSEYGGYLELARQIVDETIASMKNANQEIRKAERYLREGDIEYEAGNYKYAYEKYGISYRAATRGMTGH